MIVIALTRVPPSLRGDLTKWCQEIQTGVYVGNFRARIRDLLWDRILKNIGRGEATMVYNTNSELGYTFRTTRQDKKIVNLDGLPFMMHLSHRPEPIIYGFSKAARFHRARLAQRAKGYSLTGQLNDITDRIVALDLETTGLDYFKDEILSIGAVKKVAGQDKIFDRYVKIGRAIPDHIQKLTRLSSAFLMEHGEPLAIILDDLQSFVSDKIIVGYNLMFDREFLLSGYHKLGKVPISNQMIDLMTVVKRDRNFLDNYRLMTVLKSYGIKSSRWHHAITDANSTLELAIKLFKNGKLKI